MIGLKTTTKSMPKRESSTATNVSISFDDECKIRVLESGDFEKTKDLENECNNFVNST